MELEFQPLVEPLAVLAAPEGRLQWDLVPATPGSAGGLICFQMRTVCFPGRDMRAQDFAFPPCSHMRQVWPGEACNKRCLPTWPNLLPKSEPADNEDVHESRACSQSFCCACLRQSALSRTCTIPTSSSPTDILQSLRAIKLDTLQHSSGICMTPRI